MEMATHASAGGRGHWEIKDVGVLGMTRELPEVEAMLVGTASVALRCGLTGLGDSELEARECELIQV